MGERLTDDVLAVMERQAASYADRGDYWPVIPESALSVIRELRALRLSADDRAALAELVAQLGPPWGNPEGHRMHQHNRALAVLSRLIGATP